MLAAVDSQLIELRQKKPCSRGRFTAANRWVCTGTENSLAPGGTSCGGAEPNTGDTMVSAREAVEASREGWRSVGASHSIDEADEAFRGTPCREVDAISAVKMSLLLFPQ